MAIDLIYLPLDERSEAERRSIIRQIDEIRRAYMEQIEPYMARLAKLEAHRPLAFQLLEAELPDWLRASLQRQMDE